MSITDKEANKRLEIVQQRITLTLQTIELNFSKCNQIMSTSMLPSTDNYNEITRVILNYTKIWSCLFKPLNRINDGEHELNKSSFSSITPTDSRDLNKINRSTLEIIQKYRKIAFALRGVTNVINDNF